MPLPPFLTSIIGWLRAGYPEGVPTVDYLPLFALLGSQLTEDEVAAIADELALTGDASSTEEIKLAITRATQEKPQENEIARVRARLAAGGWPLATPDRNALSAPVLATVCNRSLTNCLPSVWRMSFEYGESTECYSRA